MADDGGAKRAAAVSEVDAPDRRGPLRPDRLRSVRTRASAGAIARFFQLGDVAGLLAATVVAARAAGPVSAEPMLITASILALVVLVGSGAYRRSAREPQWKRLGRVALAVAAGGGGASALFSLFGAAAAPGHAGEVWMLVAGVVLAGLHLGWASVLRILRRRGHLTPNLIVVGATPTARRLIARTLRTREAHILGVFDDRKDRVARTVAGVPVLGTARELIGHRVLPFVDLIVITVPREANARVAQLLENLAPIPNPIALLLDGDEPQAEAEAVNRIADFDLMQMAGPRGRSGYQLSKRGLDLALGLLALLALAPLMGLVAVAIKLDSPGPVFFRQRRHGYMNEEIVVWKFRSMRADATDHTASRQVTAGDARVTRVGRFIRKTSLDELPQLFNVISGEMSLVGPRPHAIGMLAGGADASKLVETYAHRHRIKPGLTGWAAVNGSRGPIDTPDAVRRRVALDLEYMERQSILLDLAIILKTAPALMGDSEAVR
jgi:Undecaprenyl-phosphate glucose phosphotransferase